LGDKMPFYKTDQW